MVGLIVWGSVSLSRLPIDAVPDITNNQAQIITVSPSLAAQDIERLVTFPVEQTMATIPGIEEIRSFSRFGLSVVTVVFKDDVEIYWAREQISQRLTTAKSQIPAGVGVPELAPVTTGLGEIFQYVVHPKPGYENKYTATELRTIQDWIIRRQLLGTEGVADVSSFGGFLKQYEVAIDPEKLRSAGVTMDEIFTALEKNNQNTGGAYIDKKPEAWFIRTEGLVNSIADIENIAVKNGSNGAPVLVRTVAQVRLGHATRYGAMTRNAEGEVVGAIVMMLKGANSSKVIKNVKEKISQIEKTLPEGIVIEPFLDRTKLVNNAIGTVTKNLAEGALIVIFVLVLLLGNLRAGLVVASVIPLAMLFAVGMMQLFGVSGNLMSLGAIDFGLIVDGAVIIVEATMHHLVHKGYKRRLTGAEMDKEVLTSAKKIRSSAAFGEIIILIVYLPILALVGIEGKMFRPMAQTVSFAILGAFILSLTYVPMMSALCLNKTISYKRTISDRIMDFFQRIYSPALRFSLKNKISIVIISIVAFAGTLVLFMNMGGEFIPSLDEGDFAVETRVLTGSSLSHTVEMAQKGADILIKNFPEVKQVISKIGSSEIPTDPMPIEACDMMVILKDKNEWTSAKTREELAEKMAEKLEALPGVTFGFQQPIQMRFNELMTGARQDVVVKIYGENLDQLAAYAQKAGSIIGQVEGAVDVFVEKSTGLKQIAVTVNRENMARFGVDVASLNRVLKTGFAGEVAGQVFENEKRFDLVVRLDNENRNTLADISNLYVQTPTGQSVPLGQLAKVELVSGPNQIQRDDAKRRIIIGFNVRGRDVQSIVKEVQGKLDAGLGLAPGYYTTFGGTFKNLEEARKRLSIAVPVSLLLIFVLLYFTFGSMRQGLLIFSAIPLSAIGGVLALWLRGMPFSISAGVGFIALFGVAVLNGIVLIAEFNQLKKEGFTNMNRILLKGTAVRLRPVIMTALVASLGFLPMALSNSSGAEVQRPLATVVIGGLLTATLLTLLVLPILYSYFEKGSKRKSIKKPPIIAAFIGIMIAAPLVSKAQTQPLSLDSVIKTALAHNYDVKAAGQTVLYYNQLENTATDIGKTNVSLLVGQYNSYRRDNNISINQTFPFPTVFGAQARLTKSKTESAQLQAKITQSQLVYQVKQTWYNIQYYLQIHQLLLQQDTLLRQFEATSTKRYTTGEGTLLEKTNATARLAFSKTNLDENKTHLQQQLLQLQLLMGIEMPMDNFEKQFSVEKEILQFLLKPSLQNTSLLQFAAQQTVIASNEKKAQVAKILPDISLGYFSQTLIGTQDVNGNAVFYDANKRFGGIQAGITIPLWFPPQVAKIKAAGLQTQIAQSNQKKVEMEVKTRYAQALQEFLKCAAMLNYYQQTALPTAQLLQNQGQKSWQAGEIGYREYLQNLETAIEIQKKYFETVNNYNQSAITLLFLTEN